MDRASTGLHVLKVIRIGRRQNISVFPVAADVSGQELRGLNREVFRPSKPREVQQSIIIVPSNVSAPWADDRERLWALAEKAEKRSDANLATLWEGHLPAFLCEDRRGKLAEAFGGYLADYLGSAVDLTLEAVSSDETPARLFALCSAREIHALGFGEKNRFGLSMAQRLQRGLPTSHQTELLELRSVWATLCEATMRSIGA